MLKTGPRVARIGEPEAERPRSPVGKLGDNRVVGIDDERRLGGQLGDRGAPALRDGLELAVAIELISEEVGERDDARTGPCERLRQRALVDFEEAEIGAARRHEGRRDA